MRTQLQEIVLKVREKQLKQLGHNPDEMTDKEESNVLMGRCKSNSKILSEELQEKGYETRIGAGVLRSGIWVSTEELPETFAEASRQRHPIHYWVETSSFICELASESDLHHGEPIAEKAHPEQLGYVVFPDSYNGFESQ